MTFNVEENRRKFAKLDLKRRKLMKELDKVADEMIDIWWKYSKFLEKKES